MISRSARGDTGVYAGFEYPVSSRMRNKRSGTLFIRWSARQCFGSGLEPDSIRSVDPYPDHDPGEQKLPTEIEKI